MKEMLYAVFIVVVPAGITNASARAAAAKRGGVCIDPFRGGDLVLQCEYIDKVMIKQIYEKGFRVVHMQSDKNMATYVMLVIEEQQ